MLYADILYLEKPKQNIYSMTDKIAWMTNI